MNNANDSGNTNTAMSNCCCSSPECARYGCQSNRPRVQPYLPQQSFGLDPDRNARATEALAQAINRLAAALERSDTSALQQPREAT